MFSHELEKSFKARRCTGKVSLPPLSPAVTHIQIDTYFYLPHKNTAYPANSVSCLFSLEDFSVFVHKEFPHSFVKLYNTPFYGHSTMHSTRP